MIGRLLEFAVVRKLADYQPQFYAGIHRDFYRACDSDLGFIGELGTFNEVVLLDELGKTLWPRLQELANSEQRT